MSRAVRGFFLHFNNALRTSSLPRWFVLVLVILASVSRSAEKRLTAAANYLKHWPSGRLSTSCLKEARKCAHIVSRRRATLEDVTVIRSVVVKSRRSRNEPGIILVSFENELRKILALRRLNDLLSDYRIGFFPSWQNFFSPEVIELDVRTTAPYYLMPSSFSDASIGHMLGDNARLLPFHAASWVNHRLYTLGNVPKDIDIIMLANFSPMKRHWLLFEAMSQLPDDLKVVLIGIPLGSNDKVRLMREAELFGVAHRIELVENPPQNILRMYLQRAKLMCALSHREGSYIGVAEALMANTPVAMFENAMIGTKAYIGPQTGFLLDPHRSLAGQLSGALRAANSLRPQEWAVQAISAEENSLRLNRLLRQDFLSGGCDWTADIASIFCVRFDFFYAHDVQADFSADYAMLESDFGLRIDPPKAYL